MKYSTISRPISFEGILKKWVGDEIYEGFKKAYEVSGAIICPSPHCDKLKEEVAREYGICNSEAITEYIIKTIRYIEHIIEMGIIAKKINIYIERAVGGRRLFIDYNYDYSKLFSKTRFGIGDRLDDNFVFIDRVTSLEYSKLYFDEDEIERIPPFSGSIDIDITFYKNSCENEQKALDIEKNKIVQSKSHDSTNKKKTRPKKGEFEVTQKEAAKMYGVKPRTIRVWEQEGKAPNGYPSRKDAFALRQHAEQWKLHNSQVKAAKNMNRAQVGRVGDVSGTATIEEDLEEEN